MLYQKMYELQQLISIHIWQDISIQSTAAFIKNTIIKDQTKLLILFTWKIFLRNVDEHLNTRHYIVKTKLIYT